MAKSFLTSTLIIFFTIILESTVLSNISFLLVVPDLVLIITIYLSLLNGKLYGETTGFISGLFLDFTTGVPFGFNCIYRTLMGYFYGLISHSVIISGIIMPVLSVGIGTIAKRLFIIILSLIYPNLHLNVYGFISDQFLFEFIANVALSPFIFKFLSFFKNTLSIIDTKDMIDNVQS